MKYFCTTLSLVSILLIPAGVYADDTIYKSIDKDGNISYSTTPPANSERSRSVDIAAPPSEERIKAAQDRQNRNQEAAAILDENRKQRDEIHAEQNRLKRENQKQLQQKQQAEKNNENDEYYPYIPGRRPGGIHPPIQRPRPIQRPVQLPAR